VYRAAKTRGKAVKKIILFFPWLLVLYTANINAATLRDSVGAEKCLCSLGMDAVTSATRKLTLAQAKLLVMAALTPNERRAPGLTIGEGSEYYSNSNLRFIMFHVGWAATEGSDLIGWYSVDIYTGDVFSSVAECGEYYSKKLEALQKKIRRSLRLTEVQYKKLKTNGPECVNDTGSQEIINIKVI
jgi:hypothetical protein